jgi:hypothetical protein
MLTPSEEDLLRRDLQRAIKRLDELFAKVA